MEELPNVEIAPRIGHALSTGWGILWQDIVGCSITGLVFWLLVTPIWVIFFYFAFIIVGPAQVGLIGWAEMKRRGASASVGDFFILMFRYFANALLLALARTAISLIYLASGIIIIYIMEGWISGVGPSTSQPPQIPPNPFIGLSIAMIMLFALFIIGAIVLETALNSLEAIAGWAIIKGKPFRESFSWALERIKKHLFGWCLAGIIVPFISNLGILLCIIGVFSTIPLGYLTWAELIGNIDEDFMD